MADGDRKTPGPARVTMAAVGRMAGVSQVTVSRALSDPTKVSPDTLRRINEAIEATGFVPNAVAGSLASNKSRLVSALIPSITNPIYTSFIKEFADRMREQDYQVLLSDCGFDQADEEAAISRHLSRRPDAMLLTGISHTAQARRMLLNADIPVVEVWELTESPIDLCVGFSHQEAGREVAEFAIEKGFKRAASISANDERAVRRAEAFAKTFERRSSVKVVSKVLNSQASLAAGRTALAALLDQASAEVDLVFCSSDLIAQGVIIEASERGLRIPQDIAVIGFGDQDFAAHLVPSLTTVRVDRNQMGKVAATEVLTRIRSEKIENSFVDLGFEIVVRSST